MEESALGLGVSPEEKKEKAVRPAKKAGRPAKVKADSKSAREKELERQIAELREMIAKSGDANRPIEKAVKVVAGSSSQTNFSNQPRYDIRIEQQEGEPRDQKIGVNGVVFQILKSVPVTVPECVLRVLQTATQSRLVQIPDYPNPPKEEWHDAAAVPFSVLKGPY